MNLQLSATCFGFLEPADGSKKFVLDYTLL